MKTLVIYYSLEGNTRLIAETIAETVKGDLLELKTQQELKAKGLMKYFWGGRQVITKQTPQLINFDKNINDYDLLFIGTPVWAWSYAPALNSLFTDHNIVDRKIALFACHGGGRGKVFEKMRRALNGNSILGEIDFKEPLYTNRHTAIARAGEWAAEIMAEAAKP
jgi:flavodoxin